MPAINKKRIARTTTGILSRQRGFILLPVVLAIALIAAIAYLMNNDGAMNTNMLGREIASSQARYAAKAGLNHMLWQIDQSGCSGYSNIGPTAFGKNSYSVTVTPTSGSPVSIAATGTDPGGSSYTIKRDGVNVGHGPTLTKVIQPDAATAPDTYISYLSPTINYGTSSTSPVTQRSGNNKRSLLQFDLSRFTAAATIVSANLSLYQNSFSSLGGPVSAHRLSGGAWSETASSWNNRNTVLAWTTAGGDYEASAVAVTTITAGLVDWFSWDITPLAQDWVSGTYPNNGLIVIPDTVNSDATFVSSDQANTLIPKITVSYNCPCGEECYTAAPPVTVTLNPVADAFIDSLNASKNYGASTSLRITSVPLIDEKRSLLKFDTNSIPAGSLIQNAKLRLYVSSLLSPSIFPKSISAYALTQPWVEGSKTGNGPANGVAWNTSDGSTNWTTIGGTYRTPSVAMAVEESSGISPLPAIFTSGWLTWDLTALAQEWVDAVSVNNGVILISTVGDEQVIDSKENGGSSIPQLVVTYQQ